MEKLTKTQIENINKGMIVKETEKAVLLKLNFCRIDGEEKNIDIWCPKSCIEYSECGLLKIKDWFKRNKENELHGNLYYIV